MLEQLKINLEILEHLSKMSKKKILTNSDIMFIQDQIDDLIIECEKFEKSLYKFYKLDPCDFQGVDRFFSQSWRAWQSVASISTKLSSLIFRSRNKFIPPCTEAALVYKNISRNTHLSLLEKERALLPLESLRVKQELFTGEEIYSFIGLSNGFLINSKNQALKILDRELNCIKKISFLDADQQYLNFSTRYTYKKFDGSEVIFVNTFQEHTKLLYVNILTGKYFVMPLGILENVCPERMYWWDGDELILYDEGLFYAVNTSERKVYTISHEIVAATRPDLYATLMDSLKYEVLQVLPDQCAFIYRDQKQGDIYVRYTKTNICDSLKFNNLEIFDAKILGEYSMSIEDDRIDIRKGRHKRTILEPDQNYFFQRAEFFFKNQQLCVAVLSGSTILGLSNSITIYEIADSLKELGR